MIQWDRFLITWLVADFEELLPAVYELALALAQLERELERLWPAELPEPAEEDADYEERLACAWERARPVIGAVNAEILAAVERATAGMKVQLGAIGWFADVDAGILKPHLVNQLTHAVTFPDGSSIQVGVAPSHLNWTVSPRIEVGYRLPSGFGGIAVASRNMTSQGSDAVIGADGPATLSSRLNVNLGDLDWVSNEYTPWRLWDLRWRFGVRYLNSYFDSQANEPFAAVAGTTIFNQRTTNSFWGLGPHWALAVRRRLCFGGLAIFGFLDISDTWGRVRQNFFASSTTSARGLPQTGQFIRATSDSVPVLTARLGLNWQPPAYPMFQLFAGYQLDYWWNVGRIDNILGPDLGYFFDSGIILRGAWSF